MDHAQRSALNFFADPAIDRVAHLRRDQEWIAAQLQSRSTRVIPVWQGSNLFSEQEHAPVFPTVHQLHEHLAPFDSAILLGIEDQHTYFALDLSAEDQVKQLSPLGHMCELKQAASMVDSRQAGLMFIAYSARREIFDKMLDRMFDTRGEGVHDHLMDYTRAETGAYYFAPSLEQLAGLG